MDFNQPSQPLNTNPQAQQNNQPRPIPPQPVAATPAVRVVPGNNPKDNQKFNKPGFKTANLYKLYRSANEDRRSYLKNSLLGIITVILVCVVSALLRFVILGSMPISNLWWIILMFFVCVGLMPLVFLVAQTRWMFIWALAISAGFLLPFIDYFNLYIFLAWLVMVIGIASAAFLIKSEYNLLLKIRWLRIISKGTVNILIASLIFFATVSYFAILPALKKPSVVQNMTQNIGSGISKISLGQGISLNMTVDEAISKYALSGANASSSDSGLNAILGGLPKNLISQLPSLGNLGQNQSLSKELEQQTIASARQAISTQLGIKLTGKEKLSEVVISYIGSVFNKLPPIAKILIYVLVALSILSLVGPIIWIIKWVVFLFSWISMEILLALKYLKQEHIGVDKETLTVI